MLHTGGMPACILMYADDLLLLAPTWQALLCNITLSDSADCHLDNHAKQIQNFSHL